jgi:formylglycine-generating enzyme required for sulfatase activity
MSDIDARIAKWYEKLASTDDPADQADIREMIASLEAKRDATRTHEQTIDTNTGVAVAGDVHGGVVAPHLAPGTTGVNIAQTIQIIYQHASPQQVLKHQEALHAYLTYLQRTTQSISLRGIGDDVLELPLTDLYVSLTLTEPPKKALFDLTLMREITGLLKREAADPDVHADRGQAVEWQRILHEHRRIVVVGAPGSGKSTLLQYTALALVQAMVADQPQQQDALGLEAEPLVPLLLPLRQMTPFLRGRSIDALLGDGAGLILSCMTMNYRNESLQAIDDDFFQRLCDEGRAMLLLDGLDEVTTTQDRERVSTSIRSLLRRFPTCRCVVTSRTHAYEGTARIGGDDLRVCAIAPMNPDQQQRFLENWSSCVHIHRDAQAPLGIREHKARSFTSSLWRAMEANQGIGSLRDNPLLLTIIAVIYYARNDLPENRAALYEECLRVFLRGGRDKVDLAGQERAKFSGMELHLGMEARRDLLSAVAYELHTAGRKRFTTAEFDQVVARYMQPSLESAVAAKQFAQSFRSEVLKHIGVLDELELGQYGFIHLTIQEYLTAFAIAQDKTRWPALVQEHRSDWWREVILLCAGILPRDQCWEFLRLLVKRPTNMNRLEHSVALTLAAQALSEVEPAKAVGPVREQIRQESQNLLAAPTASLRVAGGAVLAKLGDPRPGVRSFPLAMHAFAGGPFQIGNTEQEYQAIIAAEKRNKLQDAAKRWYEDTLNTAVVVVRRFALARYPVTNAQWQIFMDADGYNPDQPWWDAAGRAWLLRDDASTPGLEPWQQRQYKQQPEFWEHERYGRVRSNHPVVGISWYEAVAFATWLTQHLNDGYTYCLPSELEWEYAARGPERRMYPWGNQAPDPERANFAQTHNGTTAVGCFPAGATNEELHDLAGNVWEWTRSEYRPYPYNADDGREDGTEPAGKSFTLRGGSWDILPFYLRASYRYYNSPVNHYYFLGVRLARHASA